MEGGLSPRTRGRVPIGCRVTRQHARVLVKTRLNWGIHPGHSDAIICMRIGDEQLDRVVLEHKPSNTWTRVESCAQRECCALLLPA